MRCEKCGSTKKEVVWCDDKCCECDGNADQFCHQRRNFESCPNCEKEME